ncbi:uncharacterized protein LOC125273770 [Megalobrama amblycephala]|uniref:uncharacterized protein LOC125273770 n=1 Tax=Megalobrama amblycephala TaxID=75352 RepID=UPI0020143092|nr:uncharacterized protein LOC125273770 [Megalobrama amblycephala]
MNFINLQSNSFSFSQHKRHHNLLKTQKMAEAAKHYAFHVGIKRNCPVVSHDGHISIEYLRNALQEDTNVEQIMRDFKKLGITYELKLLDYLTRSIPNYPTPTEFHISEVTHVTDIYGLHKILESEGFKAYDNDDEKFSWWSLKIDKESIQAAEERYLEKVFPDRSQEQTERQELFLSKFTTSPAFHIDESRYGNFRFSFPLNDLMEKYRVQMCGDQDPVLREYKTKFYKQEIMYVVLVHSPEDNERFKKFPRIKNSLFVDYEENQILWKAQAIGDDIRFKLILIKEDNIAKAEPVNKEYYYYVWDHVCLAFHLKDVFKFPKETLKKSLTPCNVTKIHSAKGKCCSYEEAKEILNKLL